MSVRSISTSLVLAALTLAALQGAKRDGDVFSPKNRFSWLTAFAMGLFIKKLVSGGGKKLLTDASQAKKEVDEEYDYIIVGGGARSSSPTCFTHSTGWTIYRYIRMCIGVSSLGGPLRSSPPPRGRGKVRSHHRLSHCCTP